MWVRERGSLSVEVVCLKNWIYNQSQDETVVMVNIPPLLGPKKSRRLQWKSESKLAPMPITRSFYLLTAKKLIKENIWYFTVSIKPLQFLYSCTTFPSVHAWPFFPLHPAKKTLMAICTRPFTKIKRKRPKYEYKPPCHVNLLRLS